MTHGLQGKNVSYGVVEIKTHEGVKLKPILYIRKSKQYFDFFSFKFYSQVNLSEESRIAFPAKYKREKGRIKLIAEGNRVVELPLNYFDELYNQLIYQGEATII